MKNVVPKRVLLLSGNGSDIHELSRSGRTGRFEVTYAEGSIPPYVLDRVQMSEGFSVFEGIVGELEREDVQRVFETHNLVVSRGDLWWEGAVRPALVSDLLRVLPDLLSIRARPGDCVVFETSDPGDEDPKEILRWRDGIFTFGSDIPVADAAEEFVRHVNALTEYDPFASRNAAYSCAKIATQHGANFDLERMQDSMRVTIAAYFHQDPDEEA